MVEFWSLQAWPCCSKAGSNFVVLVIKQHWGLWFLMPSLESMSEAKGHLWGEVSNFSGTEQKQGKCQDSVTLHRLPCASEGCRRNNPHCRWREVKWHQVSDAMVRIRTQVIWVKFLALPDCQCLITKPSSRGWGWPAHHLLSWSDCLVVRTPSTQASTL